MNGVSGASVGKATRAITPEDVTQDKDLGRTVPSSYLHGAGLDKDSSWPLTASLAIETSVSDSERATLLETHSNGMEGRFVLWADYSTAS